MVSYLEVLFDQISFSSVHVYVVIISKYAKKIVDSEDSHEACVPSQAVKFQKLGQIYACSIVKGVKTLIFLCNTLKSQWDCYK